jgi:hypothetical protein
MFRLLAFVVLIFSVTASSRADIARVPPLKGSFSFALKWKTTEGKAGEKKFNRLKLADISRSGVWIAFEKKSGRVFPGVHYRGRFHSVDVPVDKMRLLYVSVAATVNKKTDVRFSTIFNQRRPFGSRGVDAANVYHLLVLNRAIDKQDLPTSPDAKAVPQKPWRDSFWRTRRLAMNFAAQSDAQTRKYEKVFDVKAKFYLPRIVLASEEWIELQAKKNKPSGGGGLFGRGLDVLNTIGEDPTPKSRRFPVYHLDVMADWVSVRGTYTRGFHTARSLWNDLLEGKVIYEATGGNRRVLTASIVFAQMKKNHANRKLPNRAILVDGKSLAKLERCRGLWSSTKRSITSFLKKNSTWKVLITEKPVTFYDDKNKPMYAMFAWYQVQPSTGRMIGMLPNGNHAGMSDEAARIARTGLNHARRRAPAKVRNGAVRGYFDQLSGTYVGAAGILEGVTLTFCNPAVVALSGADWKTFLTNHALDHAQQYLEDHAELYDSYGSQLGFWQGAMAMTGALGGPDAAKEVGRRAFGGARRQTQKDVEKFANDLNNSANNAAKKEVENAIRARTRGLNRLINGVNHTNNALTGG